MKERLAQRTWSNRFMWKMLGVNENTPLLVMNKKNSGTMIIKVRGTRLALGRRITGGIEVKEEAAS